jgi:hypothetical protein
VSRGRVEEEEEEEEERNYLQLYRAYLFHNNRKFELNFPYLDILSYSIRKSWNIVGYVIKKARDYKIKCSTVQK